MKFLLLVVLALMAITNCCALKQALDNAISNKVIDYIEGIRAQMPHGFPGLGLGSLSPLRFSHHQTALNSGGLVLEGEIDNFTLYGLDDFDIVELKVNVLTSKVNFRFHWRKLDFVTNYKIDVNSGNQLNIVRRGVAKLAIKDLNVVGTANYNIIGKLRLKEFKASATIGNVKSDIENLSQNKSVNKKLNEIIEEQILLVVNKNTEKMKELANDFVMPFVNDIIRDSTLADVLALSAPNAKVHK